MDFNKKKVHNGSKDGNYGKEGSKKKLKDEKEFILILLIQFIKFGILFFL